MFRRPKPPDVRIFFATDIHASEICFRKALAAPSFYGANVLILGGDLSGKALVPVVTQPQGGWTASFMGRIESIASEEDLERFRSRVADAGYYTWDLSDPDMINDEQAYVAAFKRGVKNRLKQWVQLADGRLQKEAIRCFVAPGNDDEFEVDEVLAESKAIINGEGTLLEIADNLWLASCGYSNPTPWDTPREESEEQLANRLEKIVSAETAASNLILNFHVPPYGTNLDVCPELDDDLKVVIKSGAIVMKSAGSTATRRFIEERQPLLGLHGHIHESKGKEHIGRTLCLNPGSTYGDGLLAGCLVDLSNDDGVWTIERFQFTSG